MKHEFNSETGEQARLKGLEVRRQRARERLEVAKLAKDISVVDLLKMNESFVNLPNDKKQDVMIYVLKQALPSIAIEKAKSKARIQESIIEHELKDISSKEAGEPSKAVGEYQESFTIEELLENGLIDINRLSNNDINTLREFM